MANRYWVGGDGNWSQANLHWSDSSGGAPSASFLPTSADNVIFDANSNTGTSAFTVCVDSSAQGNCLDFSTSSLDGTMTLQLDSTLNVYGSLTLPATNFATVTGTGGISFQATSSGYTVTTNGVDLGARAINFAGIGGAWTLGSALTATTGSISFSAGTFNTGNYNVTTGSFNTATSTTRSVSLGSSTITLNGNAFWAFSTVTNLTWNAGTSTITASSTAPTFTGAGLTYNNLSFTGAATSITVNGANTFSGTFTVTNAASTVVTFGAAQAFTGGATFSGTTQTINGGGFSHTGTVTFGSTAAGTHTINGANTWANLTVTTPAAAGTRTVSLGGDQTITGTLTANGSRADYRTNFVSTVTGTQRTLTVATLSVTSVGFQDTIAAGAATWTLALGNWNLGNNTGITFNTSTLYWVGSTGNWYDGTKWSTSSGGGGGAADAVPGPQNSVIFDANSNTGTGAFTVTVTNGACNDFSTGGAGGALDGAMTLSMGATAVLDCYGSMTLPATNLTWSGTTGALITFRATSTGKTVTTNGVTLTNMAATFNGVGGAWTLGSAISLNSTLRVTNGTFDTSASNYSISTAALALDSAGTRTVNLNASAVTLTASTPISVGSTTGLTFNAGTSTITCSVASPTFIGGGQTFYNVTFSSTASGTTTISDVNTFNNLTQTSRSATGTRNFQLAADQTVSGTLTLGAANTAVRRVLVFSNTIGTQRTITLNGTLTALADVDFRDIKAAGSVAVPWTGTRLGDGGNNTNITTATPKTVYWNLAGSQNWSATGWATTNSGAPAVNNFPLAQDTATFTEAGSAGTVTFDSAWWVGTIQMADGISNRTTAFTLATGGQTPNIYGNVTFFSSLTLSGTGTAQFAGQGTTQTITSAGITWTQPITVNSPSGTFRLADNLTNTGTTFTFTQGTLDLNSKTLTCVAFSSSNSNTRSIAFGTGQIDVTGNNTTIWATNTLTNFSYTGTSKVRFTYSGSTGTRTITPGTTTGATEANSLNFYVTAGTDTFSFISSSVGKTLDLTNFKGTLSNGVRTLYGDLIIDSGTTITSGAGFTTFAATSGTQKITTAGVTLDFPITVNSPGATVQLQDNLTIGSSRIFNLTAGTLDLTGNSGNWTLSTGVFSGSGSTTRAIAFGTGNITLTGNNTTVLAIQTATSFTYSGTSKINCTYSGAIGARNIRFGSTAGATESNVMNVNITAGTDTLNMSTSLWKNLSFSGFTGTLNAALNNTIYGDLIFSSGMLLPSTSNTITFAATSGTQTITSAGQTMDFPVAVNAPGATVSLADAFAIGSTRTLTLTAGTLTTNNNALTTGVFSSNSSSARTFNMGSSTVTVTASSASSWSVSSTSFTLNAGTSNIVLSGSGGVSFAGAGLTYYNVNFSNAAATAYAISGTNTFNNLTFSTPSFVGTKAVSISGDTTVSGTFTISGQNVNQRVVLFNADRGTPVVITAAAVSALTDIDFRQIDAEGAAIPWSGTRLGNCGGNTNILFGGAKTVYWNQPAGGNWSDPAWALTSGGATSINNFPLPQDTAIFDNVGMNAGSTLSMGAFFQVGTINFSALSNAITWSNSTFAVDTYGNLVMSSAVTPSGTGFIVFNGSAQDITTAGVTFTQPFQFQTISGTTKLIGDLTSTSTTTSTFRTGTINLNNYNLNINSFQIASAAQTKIIAFGAGAININGNNKTVWNFDDLSVFSYTGTPTVNFTYSGSTGTRTINNGNTAGLVESNAVDFNITAGTDTVATTASGLLGGCRNLNYTGFSGVGGLFGGGYIYGSLTLGTGMTFSVSALTTTFAATSGTKTITTNNVSIPRSLTFNGAGGAWSLQDDLNVLSNTLTLTNGTLNANNKNVTLGSFGLGSGTKTLNMGSGNWTVSLNWDAATNGSGLTLNAGTSTIKMTSSSSKSFSGNSKTYYNLSQDGLGTLSISGSNVFNSISNTVQPTTIGFTAGSTQTVNNFNVSGTAGNQVTLNSLTPGSQWYMAKNTGSKVLVSYCSISDSNVSPSGYWFAPTSQGNVDAGNNTGWNFASSGTSNGFFLLF